MTLLQACLNGNRPRADHPAVPITPEELAEAGRGAVAAGAAELHVHPRGSDESDTVEPDPVAAAVRAIRAVCPGTPLGLTTGLWTTNGDAERRHAHVAAWEELPDYVSANAGEEGFADLCALVTGRGVGIEVGLWSLADAETLIASGIEPMRVLVETNDLDAAGAIGAALEEGGVRVPQLHHGAHTDAWPALDAAIARGRDTRIGLEDTTFLPDGSTARDNADLVAEAARRVQA
jgi:uncharacterized protein (DUF849 family)